MSMDEAKHRESLKNPLELLNDKLQVESELMEWPEEKLNKAIRSGLQQGKRRSISRKRIRTSWQLVGALLSIFVLLTGFIRVSPGFAEMMKEIPGLGGFVDLIKHDPTITKAIEREYMQQVGVSAEKNGYKLTVDSIMADQQRLVILYTVEGPGINQDTEHLKYEIVDANNEFLRGAVTSSHYFGEQEEITEGKLNDYYDVLLGADTVMPEIVKLRMMPGDDWLEVQFVIDQTRFHEMSETVVVNKTFEIDEQRFTIKEALITPLQISIKFESDSGNSMRYNSFMNIALEDEEGHRYTSGSGFSTIDEGLFSRNFQSSYFAQPKELTLVMDGLYASEKGKTFVINTQTMETHVAPLSTIRLDGVREMSDHYELKIEMSGLDEHDARIGHTFLKHDAVFTDAAGNVYSLLDRKGIQMSTEAGEGDNKKSYHYYNIPKADYVQPLTFPVESYPGYVLDPVRIRIK